MGVIGRDFDLLTINGETIVIGSGSCGVVYLGKNVQTDEVVAIKTFRIKPVHDQLNRLIREALHQRMVRKKIKMVLHSTSPRSAVIYGL